MEMKKIIWRNIYIKETDELISFEQIEIQIFLLYESFWITTILILLKSLL